MRRAFALAALTAGIALGAPAGAHAAAAVPASLDFGTVKVGSSSQPAVVTYSVAPQDRREALVGITDFVGLPTTDYTYTTTCPPPLPPGSQTCQASVTFTPHSPGAIPATLAFGGNGFVQEVPLTGKGVPAKKPCKKKAKKGAAAAKKKSCKK